MSDLAKDLINTATGRDKVETTEPLRDTYFSHRPETHIHASSVTRHVDGGYSIEDKYTGETFEAKPGQVKSIGAAVEVKDNGY